MLKTCFAELVNAASAAALTLGAVAASAAPGAVEPFDAATWQALRKDVARPTAVVFTATWCAVCPQVVADLQRELRANKPDAQLLAVVIDAEPADAALLRSPHYRGVDRLYAFAAPAAQVQHAVNPRWRGVTPLVALLSPGAAPLWSTGAPSADSLQTWMARR